MVLIFSATINAALPAAGPASDKMASDRPQSGEPG